MKSIKIKLGFENKTKEQKLLSILSTLELISKDYLSIRLKEIETKQYQLFKDHYTNYRSLYPSLNSGMLQNHLRSLDSTIKSYISWCKKKHKLVKFPKTVKASIPLRNDMFHFEFNKNTKTFNGWLKFLKIYFPLKLCEYHLKTLSDMESMCDSSIIKDKKGDLYLRLCFEAKQKQLNFNKTLGIDIGIVKPIVCSNRKQFGSGRYIKHKKLEFAKRRSKS